MRLRANSATAPSSVKTIFPAGVDVSSNSLSETKWMPSAWEVSRRGAGIERREARHPAIPKPFSVSWSFSATLFLTFGLPNLLQKSSSASFCPPVIRDRN